MNGHTQGPPQLDLPHFDGSTFDPDLDGVRLTGQARAVRTVLADGGWYTLAELASRVHAPEASVSARLRDFRKPRWGGLVIERRRRTRGTWEYRWLRPCR